MFPALDKKLGDRGGSSPFDTKGTGKHQMLPLYLDSHVREASSTSCFGTHPGVSPAYACVDRVRTGRKNDVVNARNKQSIAITYWHGHVEA
jgi:hypothetical protein